MTVTKNVFRSVAKFTLDVADEILAVFNDEAAFKLIAFDLGLNRDLAIPQNELRDARNALAAVKVHGFIESNEEKIADIAEALSQLDDLLSNLKVLIDALKDDDLGRTASETLYLMFQFFTARNVRRDAPMLYALSLLGIAAWDTKETLPGFDLATLFSLSLDTEQGAINYTRSMAAFGAILPNFWPSLSIDKLTSYHGWDLSPTLPKDLDTTPKANSLLRRAFTLRYGDDGALSLTVLFVTREHGGPGVVLSLGGDFQVEETLPKHLLSDGTFGPTEDAIRYAFRLASGGGAQIFLPWGESPTPSRFAGQVHPTIELSAQKAKSGGPPVYRVGSKDKTRLEIGDLGIRTYLQKGALGTSIDFNSNKLAISVGDDADGFLAEMSGGNPVDFKFDFGFGADTDRGFYLSGGNGLKVNLPLTSTVGSVFRIEGLALAIKPSKTLGMDVSAEFTGTFGLDLGPFKVSVEEMGLTLDLGFGSPPSDPIDYPGMLLDSSWMRAGMSYKPPAGMGLFLDHKEIRGGGYLYFNPDNHEYAGVLELQLGKCIHLKAAGILTTKLEDSDGWALLIIISADFSPFQLGLGFTLDGVGGILGLQHGASTEKLQSGLRTGAMDHILFPDDPVKNAPQLLNTLRTVFPIAPRALTFGPTVLLGWGTPPTIQAKLGLLLQWNNVIQAGNGNAELAQLVLLGQLEVNIPPKEEIKRGKKGELVSLLVDVLGSYDFQDSYLAIDARLRNSKIAKLGVKGSLAVRAQFGDDPSLLLAVGGFHPRFEDLPIGMPKQDRMTLELSRGPLKANYAMYFAMTSNTFQIGIRADIKVKAGPVKVHAYVSIDALLDLETRQFEVDFDIGASVKFKGKTLAGVNVKGILAGPGRWSVIGSGKVKVLIFKKRFSFNRTWGDEPIIPAVEVPVGDLIRQALADPANWSAQVPGDGNGLVTLSGAVSLGLLVHPWAKLEVRQKVVPLGLTIETYGQATPSDGNRFEITTVRIDGNEIKPKTVQEHFARSQYLRNTGDRLRAPSFETFDAGVSVSGDKFVDTAVSLDVDTNFETVYLDEPGAVEKSQTISRPDLAVFFVHYSKVASANARLQPVTAPKFKLLPLQYTLLNSTDLTPSANTPSTNFSLAEARRTAGQNQVIFTADYGLVA